MDKLNIEDQENITPTFTIVPPVLQTFNISDASENISSSFPLQKNLKIISPMEHLTSKENIPHIFNASHLKVKFLLLYYT